MAWYGNTGSLPQVEDKVDLNVSEPSQVIESLPQTSSWTMKNLFESLNLPSSGVGLFIVSTVGLTIVGTTTHFIWTRLNNRRLATEEDEEMTEDELLR